MTPTEARERFSAAGGAAVPDLRTRRDPRWAIPPRTALLALVIVAAVVAVGWMWSASAQPSDPVSVAEPRATPTLELTTDPAAPLLVHVVGQVATPGLVELPTGSRVADALDAAGGALPDADLTALNLAAPVQDGAQVRVPAPGEQAPTPAQGSDAAAGLIDVNRASATELEQLPGVGPVLAARIVADREENGPFGSVDDLERVSGIGPSVLATLRDQATT